MKPKSKNELPTPPCVVLAEDDPELLSLLASVLEGEGYEVERIADGRELDRFLWTGHWERRIPPAVVVSDIRMPCFSGLEVLEELRRAGRVQPVVLITAFGDEATHEQARQLGAVAVLDKPFELEELVELVNATAEPSHPVRRHGSAARQVG